MILKTERRKLKRLLKNRYIPDVLRILEENDIKTINGEPYCKSFVSQVFNGLKSQPDIEDAIYKVYHDRKKEQSKMKARRQELLNS